MSSELSLFKALSGDDQAGALLSSVLGPGWDTMSSSSTAVATVAHTLLSTFNWVALSAVSLLFIIVMVQGVAGTACEGVPLGRRYSSLWMPLRFAGALGFLAPIIKGLSVFQVLMLMAVGASVNLANHLWSNGLEHFVQTGARVSIVAPDALVDDSRELGEGLLRALTIQEYFRQRLDMGLAGPIAPETYWPPSGDVEGMMVLTLASPPGSALAPGDLGRLRIPCPDPNSSLCQARLSAARTLVAELMPLAEVLADPDAQTTLAMSSLLSRAVDRYQQFVQPYLEMVGDEQAAELQSDLKEFHEAAEINGWVTAGAYYWTIARLNERAASMMYSTATWSEGDPPLDGEVMEDFEVVFERLNRYLKGAFSPERSASVEKPPSEFPSFEWFNDKLSGYIGRLSLSTLISRLESGDPIAVLAGLGRFLVVSGEAIIALKIGSSALAAATGESSSSLLGQALSLFTGSISSFLAGAAIGTVDAIGPYLLLISVTILGYGLFLAYFLPALPFLIWIGAVVTWAALVIEALAAAPLWVAAHALPEGEGFSGQAGRQGYFLFLGVLLRPPMMVLGFLLAMTMMSAIGRMTGHIFSVFGFDRLGESFLGVAGFLAFAVILGLAGSPQPGRCLD
jgi:hypothetical protein